MPDSLPVRDLLTHIIGGGWGSDSADDVNEQPVAIIRGADFPQVQVGDVTSLPFRFESSRRVGTRRLQDGDIVLEISGGTNERPTGRSVFVSQSLLAQVSVPVIPASFCRLLRPNPLMVEPRYLYFWLQDMFEQGRTWAYQVRSTGIANFQTEYFLDHELVTLPPLDEQRHIAGVLGTLDDLIEVNRKLLKDLLALSRAVYQRERGHASGELPLQDLYKVGLGGVWGEEEPTAKASTQAIVLRGRDLEDVAEVIPAQPPVRFVSSQQAERRLPVVGDIWTAGSGSLGPTLPITENFVEIFGGTSVLYSNFVKRLVPTNDPTWFGTAWLSIVDAWKAGAFENFRTGTAMPNLDPDALLRGVTVPDLPQQVREQINNFVSIALGPELRHEIRDLARARDELLPLLMSGRVRVREDGVAA